MYDRYARTSRKPPSAANTLQIGIDCVRVNSPMMAIDLVEDQLQDNKHDHVCIFGISRRNEAM